MIPKAIILLLTISTLIGCKQTAKEKKEESKMTEQEQFQAQVEATTNLFLYPPAQPFPKTPADHGYQYRDVEFPSSDGLTLSGWLLNENADKVIIMSHFGYRANRFGYQIKHQGDVLPYEKEIEFVKVAGRLIDAGYAVLMYDLRNHGLSEKTKEAAGTGGTEEARDIMGAVKFVAANETTKGKPIGLLSYCMSANASIIAYGKDLDLLEQSNVKALIAMQPLTNSDFLKTLGLPSEVFNAVSKRFKEITGYNFYAPVLADVPAVQVPTLLCQGRNDPNTNLNFIHDIYENLPEEKELYWLEDVTHRFDGYNWFYDHPEKMLEWFNKYVK